MRFHSEPIEAIIGRLYTAPTTRRGDRSGRLWWVCPFHDDHNPSLCVVPGESHYHCFGCGAHGDAIDFVRRLNPSMSFREAVQALGGDPHRSPARPSRPPAPPVPHAESDRPEGWQEFARQVVTEAESMLWTDQGAEARSYLSERGLREDTIRAARLGYRPADEWVEGIYPDRKVWIPRGIVIPWFDGSDVVMINVRRPEGDPKYVAVRGSHRGGLYPSSSGIIAGKPVLIVEGEFDALLLGQELEGLAPVVTLGSAGNKPSTRVKNAMLGASPWIVAGDADEAGEKSADGWLSRYDRCVRLKPPSEMGKDWTEAHQSGLSLREWWQEVLDRLTRNARSVEPISSLSKLTSNVTEGEPKSSEVVEGFSLPDPPPRSPRAAVAGWLPEWRERWGAVANAYCAQGIPWREAEERAAVEVEAEMEAAGFGPPPVMDPDPRTALWRDILNEMFASGEAARYLSPAESRRAKTLLAAQPLDGHALGSVVGEVTARKFSERRRVLGIPEPVDAGRWHCKSPYCLHKGRWWISVHGVVNCANCRPPASRALVAAEGDSEDAPCVLPNRTNSERHYKALEARESSGTYAGAVTQISRGAWEEKLTRLPRAVRCSHSQTPPHHSSVDAQHGFAVRHEQMSLL